MKKRRIRKQQASTTCEACGKSDVYSLLKHLQYNDSCNTYYEHKHQS